MKYRKLFLIALVSLVVNGCASSTVSISPADAHKLCYSNIYGNVGVKPNYEQAYKWCSITADYGHPSAITLLAELYLHGNGVDKNLEKALRLYETAALKDHAHAQLMYYILVNDDLGETSSEEQKEKGLVFLNSSRDKDYKKAKERYESDFGKEI